MNSSHHGFIEVQSFGLILLKKDYEALIGVDFFQTQENTLKVEISTFTHQMLSTKRRVIRDGQTIIIHVEGQRKHANTTIF